MGKLKVSLSIGCSTAVRTAVINVDDRDLAECETEEDEDALLYERWKDWADNYIEAEFELV